MSLFGSSVEQKEVETATSELLLSTDWGAITELCDKIKVADDRGAKYLKAIIKRVKNKDTKIALFALDLLGSAMSNCGSDFHRLMNEQVGEIAAVAAPKGPVDQDVSEKCLSLIMSWAEAFAKHPEFKNFFEVYQRLRQNQVPFPARDATAPVLTPKPRAKPVDQKQAVPPAHAEPDNPLSWVSPAYITKLKSELKEVMNYVNIVRDMLSAMTTSEEARKNDTLKSLLLSLQEMQSRLTRILVEVEHESLVDLCIQVNDHVQLVLLWYKAKAADQPFQPAQLPAPKLDDEKSDEKGDVKGDHKGDHPVEVNAEEDEFDAIANRHEKKNAPKTQDILSLDGVQMGEADPAPAAKPAEVSAQDLEDLLNQTDPKSAPQAADADLDDLLKEANNS